MCSEFLANESLLLLVISLLFQQLNRHFSSTVRLINTIGMSVIFSLFGHPNFRIAEFAIGAICRIIDISFDTEFKPGKRPQINLSELPFVIIRTHCENESDPLLWASLQLLRAICRADFLYSVEQEIPQFLVAFVAETSVYRLRSEALLGIAGILAGIQPPVLESFPGGAAGVVKSLLRVLLDSVDNDQQMAHVMLWAILMLKVRFAGYGASPQLEQVFLECEVQEFLDGCEEFQDNQIVKLLELINGLQLDDLENAMLNQESLHREVRSQQAYVDVMKGKKTLRFVYKPE
jgi:hypothetical protein